MREPGSYRRRGGAAAVLSGLLGRIVRAAWLDPALYREVREDASVGVQAVAVVLLVALAHGVGGTIRALLLGWSPVEGFVLGPAGELLFWVAASVAIFLIGRHIFGGASTYGEVARPFGFTAAPGLLILVAASASGVGGETLLLPVIFLWRLAAGFVAVRAAFGLGPVRTTVTLLAGVVAGALAVGVILRLLVSLAGWE
ncbi:MAG TPA: YIP1 family protein [Herpetosiphonaceae bacterium]|nr:YIP1 family protein [Herpetosiphonaceae bacterium]